jgi:molecular chaperone GrpE (heat shock protein)
VRFSETLPAPGIPPDFPRLTRVLALPQPFLYTIHTMSDQSHPSVPKWPFFLGDAFLLALAWFVYSQSRLPMDAVALTAVCSCVALGALLGILPFVLEYRLALKLAETSALTSTAAQFQNLETITTQISQATGQWQTVQEHSAQTVAASKAIGERMAAEAKAFGEFMQKANDTEKNTLRLEVEKLRRAENEWLQVVVRMLDHTFALHTAAVRSGKAALVEQLTQFQNALRDSARRVGLTPFVANPGDAFDGTRHQPSESEQPAPDATIHETVATGFTFRGQLIRPALVTLAKPESEEQPVAPEPEARPEAEPAPAPTSPAPPAAQEQTLF